MIYFELGIILILGLLLSNASDSVISIEKKRTIYIVVCLTLFLLMAALRNIDWAASLHLDAGGYANLFFLYRSMDWSTLFAAFLQRYTGQIVDIDMGYYILNKVISIFTDSYNIFSLVVDLLFFVPFGLLLYRYNTTVRQDTFAFIFYVALIQVHIISGARQMLAVGLDLLAVIFAVDGKRAKAIIIFLLGTTLHFSSLLSAIPLTLILIDIKPGIQKCLHIVSLIIFPIVLMFPNQIITFLASLVGSDRYASYGTSAVQGGANTYIILMGVLSLFCFFAINMNDLEENINIRKLYNMVPWFTIFAPLIHSNGSMIRICMYFFIYLTVLIPYGLDSIFTRNSQKLAYSIVIATLVFLILQGGVMDYHFMWQAL